MPFPTMNQDSDRFFNNADSFAMAFDETWKSHSLQTKNSQTSKEERMKLALKQIKDHPFLKNYPQEAKEVAYFRLRLLNLE